MSEPTETTECKWTDDGDYEGWDTACDEVYVLEYDLRQNQRSYRYCPGCGKPIKLAESEHEYP